MSFEDENETKRLLKELPFLTYSLKNHTLNHLMT